MSTFLGRAVIEHLGKGRYKVVKPLVFRLTEDIEFPDIPLVGEKFKELVVPSGFTTDLDSMPRIPFLHAWLKGRAVEEAIIHDFLYSKLVDRAQADKLFRVAMGAQKVAPWRKWVIWLGVRMGGWLHYWRNRR